MNPQRARVALKQMKPEKTLKRVLAAKLTCSTTALPRA
jgi:hypothetical protein